MAIDKRDKMDVQSRIKEILKELGVKYLRIGDMYLEEAVEIAYEKPDAAYRCRENIYDVIAKWHNVSRASVEVALGYEIKRIREKSKIDVLKKYFGRTIEGRRKLLKPSEVIGRLAEYIRIQDAPQSLESRISKILIDLGLFSITYATKYLTEAVQIVYNKPENMNLRIGKVCEQIAQKYDVIKQVVVRSLDSAAQYFRDQSDVKVLKGFFGEAIAIRKKEMTLIGMIGILVEYLHAQENPQSLECIISKVLMEFGIFSSASGGRYLKDAICIFYDKRVPVSTQILKVYTLIAEKYGISEMAVEKSIRSVIEQAWQRENQEVISKYFGNVSSKEKDRPTNGQFIANIVNYLHLQEVMHNPVIHRITIILNEIGMDPKTFGYNWLIRIIERCYEKPTMIINYAITMQEEFKRNNMEISFTVNNVILRAWRHMPEDVFEKYFKLLSGNYFRRDKKPTSTDFILAIVYYLKAEDAKNS